MKITIETEIDVAELMDSVFNNLWSNHSPWIESIEYDYDDPNRAEIPVPVVCWNPDEVDYDDPDNFLTKTLTGKDLVKALEAIVNGNHYHCFGIRITADMEEWDTCCADRVIQMALYGKQVFV